MDKYYGVYGDLFKLCVAAPPGTPGRMRHTLP
jgi:hypothetical protein